MTRSFLGLLVALAAMTAVGCGSGDPFAYVKVSGRITYEDGTPIPSDSVIVTFAPQTEAVGEDFHPRSGMAYADTNGNFDTATSYKYGDGIVRGKHKVLVSIRSGGPTGPSSGGKKRGPLIPAIYTKLSTTPLEVHTDDTPFELKIEKPAP